MTRGRKRKAVDEKPRKTAAAENDDKQEETAAAAADAPPASPETKRGNLRRRDTLRASKRYSPPPPAPTRSRGSGRLSFPSTSHSNHSFNATAAAADDADAADAAASTASAAAASSTTSTAAAAKSDSGPATYANTGSSRRKSLGLRNTAGSASAASSSTTVVENIEIAKKDGDQIVLQLKDGTQQSIQLPKGSSATVADDEGEAPPAKDNDPDYKPAPRSSGRRKSDHHSSSASTSASTETVTITTTGGDLTKTPRVSNSTTLKLTTNTGGHQTGGHGGSLGSLSKAAVIAATSSVNKSHIVANATGAAHKANLPAILGKPAGGTPNTPLAQGLVLKSAVSALVQPTRTSRAGQALQAAQNMGKYLDNLPEVVDCINADNIDDKEMKKLPDKILLVNSELPLPLSVHIEQTNGEKDDFLFLQIVSPVQSNRFICLLCKGIDVNFSTKEEKDILLHYQSLHELDVKTGTAKFSEETVFICLPKMVLSQLDGSSNSLQLNSACQYCDSRLNDIVDMKAHYKDEHGKEVVLMEQEEIMKMHHNFYCQLCKQSSVDFDSHHKHMKVEHALKTYRCKSCVLVTQDENRLRSHYKAKHMLHTSGQNYSCYYCHGLLIGVERLLKHIQQAHMVQTGTDYSCVSCQQQCGRGKELLNHAERCKLAGIKPEQHNLHYVAPRLALTPPADGQVDCYFCSVRLESAEAYELHLHHEHMKWIGKSGGTAAAVETKKEAEDGTVTTTPSTSSATTSNSTSTSKQMLTIDDVISEEEVERAAIKTYVGHWCRLCDQMIKVYPLFYLHMVNYHNSEKKFECIISDCRAQFTDFEEFKNHIEQAEHSQKTIISHPDEVSVCTYCDIYFATEEQLVNHLITDAHINKFTSSGHFHRTEPRNFKCKACHTFFGMKESYIHHLETEDHKYMCHYCGITTATPSARRAHVQNTHPERLGYCEECAEQHPDIMAHFVSHGFTFDCQKCVKKFYNRERLNAHMEVHLDAIQCNWDECNRTIATRSMLVTHYRGHKSAHKCNICGQAFWNFSMLTSHQRSHNTAPRASTGNTSALKAAAIAKYTQQLATYSNSGNSVRNPPARRTIGGTSSSTVAGAALNLPGGATIQCGHCKGLFTNQKDLNAHHCKAARGRASTSAGALNNGGMDAAKPSPASMKAGTSKQVASMHHHQPARGGQRKGASPVKRQQQQLQHQPPSSAAASLTQEDVDLALDQSIAEANADEDTQLIMILNQVTGELMEITAPKGMEVKDVIESLNFQQMEETVAVQLMGDGQEGGGQEQQQVEEEVAEGHEQHQPEEVVAVQHIAQHEGGEEEGGQMILHHQGEEHQVLMEVPQEMAAEGHQVLLMQQEGEEGDGGHQQVMIIQQAGGEGEEVMDQQHHHHQVVEATEEEIVAAAQAAANQQQQQNEVGGGVAVVDPAYMSNILF